MNIEEQFNLFDAGKIPWIDVAKSLHDAIERNEPIPSAMSQRKDLRKLIRAYQFAEKENILDDSRLRVLPLAKASYMSFFKKTLVEDPQRYQKLKEDVLNGKINQQGMEKLSKEFQGKGVQGSGCQFYQRHL